MSATYHVLAVNGERRWKGQHGEFVDYDLEVTADGGETVLSVTNTRKPDSPAPNPQDLIYGSITEQEIEKKDGSGTFTKLKLKREQAPDGAPSGGPQAGSNTRVAPSQSPSGEAVDNRSARIERQHSQEMALRTLALRGQTDADPTDLLATVRQLTDWFVADLERASSPPKTDNGAGAKPPSSQPAPAPESVEQAVEEAVEKGELVDVADPGESF